MNQPSRCAFLALLVAAAVSAAAPAYADVTVSGDVSPQNPSDPWDISQSVLLVGGASDPWEATYDSGQVTIENRGTLKSGGAVVGANDFITGSVRVVGYGSKWINNGSLALCRRGFSAGLVSVQNGAQVTTDDLVVGEQGYATDAELLIEGYGATVTSHGDATIGQSESNSYLTIQQGGSFFSKNAYIGVWTGNGVVTLTGYGSKWVNTGEFIVAPSGNATLDIGYQAKLSTVNAEIAGSSFAGYMGGHVNVSGYGATWTNQGLLLVGTYAYGDLTVGALGTLVTEDTEIRSEAGGGFLRVSGPQASWKNSGSATILAVAAFEPAIDIDHGGAATIDGMLQILPLYEQPDDYGPPVRLGSGTLTAGAIDTLGGRLDFAGGRLSVGSFVGNLDNTQSGTLEVGKAYPSTAIVGSYSQGPSARLSVTVSGSSAAPLLQVDGDVSLGGVLDVRPATGAVSFQAGDTITVLGWGGTLTGTFSAVNIALPLPPGLAWDTSALYTTGTVTVVPAA